jgi:zinc protease
MVFNKKSYKIKFIFLIPIFVILILISFSSCRKTSQEVRSLNAQTSFLKNGLKLVTLERHNSSSVSVVLIIKAGAAHPYEFAGTGMAHLVEHMLFKGSRQFKGEEINQKFNTLGGYINAYTTLDYTAVHLSVLSQNLDEALEVLADMVFNSEFSDLEIEKERQVILNEINLNMDDPDKRLTRELFLASYRESPYRHPVIGYKDLLMGLSRDKIFEFYQKYYCPNNMILAIVGDINQKDVIKLVEKNFAAFKREKLTEEAFVEEPRQTSLQRIDVNFAIPTAKIAFAYHSVDIFDNDLFALDALSLICAGMPGSIFETELVEKKKIAFSVNTANYTPRHDGLFIITVECKTQAVEEVIQTVKKLTQNLKTKELSQAQLMRAKNYFLTDYFKGLETNEGLASRLAIDYALMGDYNFSTKYLESIRRLKISQLKQVASKYLTDSNLTILVLSPELREKSYEPQTPAAEKPIIKIFPGDLRVIFKEDKSAPLANIRVTYLGGLRSETKPFWGISNLVASLLFEGTKNLNKDEIDNFLSKRGAILSTYSANNTFGFSIEFLGEYSQDIIKLVEEIMLRPSFPLRQIEKQKQIIKAHIKREQSDVFQLGYLTVKESLYPENHPLSHSKLGELKSIDLLERKDIMNYYQKQLSSSQIVVSIFGNFDFKQISPYLENISRKLIRKRKEPIKVELPQMVVSPSKKRITKYLPRKQSVVLMGFKTIGIRNNDRFALEVLTKIISGSGERLYESVRGERGLSYTLGAFNTYGLDEGFYIIYIATTKNFVEEVINSIKKQIVLLKENTVSKQELERAKNSIIGDFLRGLQQKSNFSLTLSLDELYGFGYDFYNEYPKRIRGVTAQDIREIAKKYFRDENSVTVIISPR